MGDQRIEPAAAAILQSLNTKLSKEKDLQGDNPSSPITSSIFSTLNKLKGTEKRQNHTKCISTLGWRFMQVLHMTPSTIMQKTSTVCPNTLSSSSTLASSSVNRRPDQMQKNGFMVSAISSAFHPPRRAESDNGTHGTHQQAPDELQQPPTQHRQAEQSVMTRKRTWPSIWAHFAHEKTRDSRVSECSPSLLHHKILKIPFHLNID